MPIISSWRDGTVRFLSSDISEDVLRAMRDEWPSNTYRLGEDGLPFSCPYCIHDW